MISQNWIINDKKVLASVSRWPNNIKSKDIKAGVLLIPGFGGAMSDDNYYFSKLAMRLNDLGYYVLQVDPQGHGDSCGNLDDITFESYSNDINSAINYMKMQLKCSIYCVSRGLGLTMLVRTANSMDIEGVAGINPYCLAKEAFFDTWGPFTEEYFEVSDYIIGSHYDDIEQSKLSFLEALGADIENLQGQKISKKLIDDFCQTDLSEIFMKINKKSLFLLTDDMNKNTVIEWKPTEENPFLKLDTRKHYSLPYSPLWHHNSIEYICEWIKANVEKE